MKVWNSRTKASEKELLNTAKTARLLHKEINVEVSDTTMFNSSNAAGNKKEIK